MGKKTTEKVATKQSKPKQQVKESSMGSKPSTGATVAKYAIIGFLVLSMVGSMFAYLISALQTL